MVLEVLQIIGLGHIYQEECSMSLFHNLKCNIKLIKCALILCFGTFAVLVDV